MLTESEREWLKNRRNKAYCRYCSGIYLCSNPNASGFKCPLIPDYKNAALFEVRVAARLASYVETFGWKDCGRELLKQASLVVEEEMEEMYDD